MCLIPSFNPSRHGKAELDAALHSARAEEEKKKRAAGAGLLNAYTRRKAKEATEAQEEAEELFASGFATFDGVRVRVICGRDLHDMETVVSMTPYVKARHCRCRQRQD